MIGVSVLKKKKKNIYTMQGTEHTQITLVGKVQGRIMGVGYSF